jgi:hypothetical protein
MCSRSSSGNWVLESELMLVGADFRSWSRSAAAHSGHKSEGLGVRLVGYLFIAPECVLGGRGVFRLLVI